MSVYVNATNWSLFSNDLHNLTVAVRVEWIPVDCMSGIVNVVILNVQVLIFLGEPMDSLHKEGVPPPPQVPLKIDHSEVQDISTSPDTDTTNSTAPTTPRDDAAPTPAEKPTNVTPKPGQSHRICIFSIYTLTLRSFKYKAFFCLFFEFGSFQSASHWTDWLVTNTVC